MKDFTFKNRTSIIIIIVLVFVVAGLLIWLVTMKKSEPAPSSDHILTEAEIQDLREQGSAKGPDTLTVDQKAGMEKNGSATTSETLTDDEKNALVQSGSAK